MTELEPTMPVTLAAGLDAGRLGSLAADGLLAMDDGELFLELRRDEQLTFEDGRLKVATSELRQGFGGHSGLVADVRLDRIIRARPDLILSAGPRLAWGSRDFATTYFGVDEVQSRRSGYAVFRPGDYWFAGVAAGVTHVISDRWAAIGYGYIGRILGDAEDSPLVEKGRASQGVVGLNLVYRFLP